MNSGHKEEQLLVWFHEQTCRIMGLQELRDEMTTQCFQCPQNEQELNRQFSFLTRTCFLHTKWKDWGTGKCLKHGTNFHSLAHDMEKEASEGCKSVLLEKTNCLDGAWREEVLKTGLVSSNRNMMRLHRAELMGQKESMFSEMQDVKQDGRNRAGSAFSPVLGRRKISPFSMLRKNYRTGEISFCNTMNGVTGMRATDFHTVISTPPECFSLADKLSSHDFSEVWPKPETATHHRPPQPLPPSFTPLGSTAQNWCAKCRLCFHMTSDLVFHMRSRHKRGTGAGTQRERRRELQLTCPVCYASFRERHHLSRHMTSHC